MSSHEQSVGPCGPIWISDSESKGFLRSRKLLGDWTLTIDARMFDSEVFYPNSFVYDDASFLSQLSFFRLNDDCSALEWDQNSLNCRIWILIRDVTEAEISKKLRLLTDVFSTRIDFRNARLSLEEEPNVLTLAGAETKRLCDLREVVSKGERQLNALLEERKTGQVS